MKRQLALLAAFVGACLFAIALAQSPQASGQSGLESEDTKTGAPSQSSGAASAAGDPHDGESKWERKPLPKTNAEWRRVLTRSQYNVLRGRGTEKAFTGKYWKTKAPGVYRCAGCGQAVFSSATKFDSKTGWPSFWAPLDKECIGTEIETRFFMRRIEVHCSRCRGHLGHVFSDGPRPTGLRYCLNSAALVLDKESPPVPSKPDKSDQ